eukprot:TRINITY_DN3153_c0_g1_i2.p1 TRINITY_DN3153_c0_g1~~TRINITY_DN3153_c0_g1_i2.p1  ORF type:complete len:289 (-),score=95.73 TRINITY_DN3153_c0_g1_i2:132-998(-)
MSESVLKQLLESADDDLISKMNKEHIEKLQSLISKLGVSDKDAKSQAGDDDLEDDSFSEGQLDEMTDEEDEDKDSNDEEEDTERDANSGDDLVSLPSARPTVTDRQLATNRSEYEDDYDDEDEYPALEGVEMVCQFEGEPPADGEDEYDLHPQRGDIVKVQYTAFFAGSGTKFESSRDRLRPFQFKLGVGQVIPGWDRSIPRMRRGSRWEIIVPSEAAYGPEGRSPLIPPNSDLRFDIELIDFFEPEEWVPTYGDDGSEEEEEEEEINNRISDGVMRRTAPVDRTALP